MNKSNLIKCQDCGHEVSLSAIVCPNCGFKKTKKQILIEHWNNMSIIKKIGVSGFIITLLVASILATPDKCECNQLMTKYGNLKSDNQFVPKIDKDAHMRCVKHYLIAPTNEDGSNPCDK